MTPSRGSIDAYRDEIRRVSNAEIIDRTAREVLNAAIMYRFPRVNTGEHDDRCDALYEEALHRGNVDLYVRGYNHALRSQGHEPSSSRP